MLFENYEEIEGSMKYGIAILKWNAVLSVLRYVERNVKDMLSQVPFLVGQLLVGGSPRSHSIQLNVLHIDPHSV